MTKLNQRPNYEAFTESQFEELINKFFGELEDFTYDIEDIPYENRGFILGRADEIIREVRRFDEYLSDELYERSIDLIQGLFRLSDIAYEGPVNPRDSYAEVGMSISDFF